MKGGRRWLTPLAVTVLTVGTPAQMLPPARLAVLQAEDRRAPTPADLVRIRTSARGLDSQTARIALRALGRLERPTLIPDILPGLRHPLPELRSEAANALAQAAQGWTRSPVSTSPGAATPTSVLEALAARLEVEEDPDVRAAICQSIGRLPYGNPEDVLRAEAELVNLTVRSASVPDRLGVAKGLEALVRTSGGLQPPTERAVDVLRVLAGALEPRTDAVALEGSGSEPPARGPLILPRDARVRRLAFEALIAAGAVDEGLIGLAAVDADPQVRRLALRASAASGRNTDTIVDATDDPSPMVRVEALRSLPTRGEDATCRLAIVMTADADAGVALAALDQLAGCGHWQQAITLLEGVAGEASRAPASRRWQRPAHAIVALGRAAPQRARELLAPFVESGTWQLRLYAARAATAAHDEAVLRTLAVDRDDNVVEAALAGLAQVAGQSSTDVFLTALSRHGYHVIRTAALALEHTLDTTRAVPALTSALDRLVVESGPGAEYARDALVATLTKLGSPPPPKKPLAPRVPPANEILTAANLRRLAAPRARIVVRDVGSIELALFTSEAPATVLRFADLAESGYYNGLTFHHVEPNSIVRGGSPGANDDAGAGPRLRDEVGLWPHVRGTVGLATRGRDTGDGQFFINLVDNPAFDHRYTVFAQVLNGLEVVDRILEGDVIERVEIIP